VTVYILVNF